MPDLNPLFPINSFVIFTSAELLNSGIKSIKVFMDLLRKLLSDILINLG